MSHNVPKDSWGILVNPGSDWNSVYTYFSGLHLKVAGVETLTPEQMKIWKDEGYSYMILHEYEKYPDYLHIVKPEHSVDFLEEKSITFELGEYRIYSL